VCLYIALSKGTPGSGPIFDLPLPLCGLFNFVLGLSETWRERSLTSLAVGSMLGADWMPARKVDSSK
jgi:hypothetical protein